MVKIGTKNESRWGSKITLFAAGIVAISETGEFDVETDEVANDVEETYFPEFYIVDGERIAEEEKVEEVLQKKAEDDELNQGGKNDLGLSPEEKDAFIASLDKMKMPELRKLAEPFPKDQWWSLRKEELLDYLKKQLS